MNFINYISNIAVPICILIILLYGINQKINVFDIFLKGAEEGLKIVINIFPTLIGLFLAIKLLSNSGVLDFFVNLMSPALNYLNIPKEIMPIAFLRPISGSGSIAISTELMKKFGVDSQIGLIIATILGSTETILYTVAVYTSSVKVKKTRFVLIASFSATIVGMIASIIFWRFLS